MSVIRRQYLILFVIFSCASQVIAQRYGVSGWVFDKSTLETIPTALVLDEQSSFFGATTEQGYFQITTKKGKRSLLFSAVGYRNLRIELDVNTQVSKNIFLEPLDEDEEDSATQYFCLYDNSISYYKPLKTQIQRTKSLFGISDPVKLVQFLPGVSGGIEGLSGLYVRGSNADQNLILMNGLPVYGNGHIYGLVSNFNPEIIKSCDFYRGVSPARYGGRAGGGVLDIQTSGGSAEEWSGLMNVDFLTGNIAANGPLDSKGKWTTSFAIRRSYLDLMFPSLNSIGIYGNIHDINFNLNYKKSSTEHWNFWIYNGRDKYGIGLSQDGTDSFGRRVQLNINMGSQWQNTLSGLSYSRVLNARTFMNAMAGFSRYTYQFNIGIDGSITTDSQNTSSKTQTANLQLTESSSITDYSLQANFSYLLSSVSKLRYGSQLITHDIRPGNQRDYEVYNGKTAVDTIYGLTNNSLVTEWSNYAELEFHPNVGLSFNIGGRAWTYLSSTNKFFRFEPRLVLNQLLQGQKRIQIGFSTNYQGIHQLSSVTGILPSDVWFPTTGNFKPQSTTQLTGAFIKPLGNGFEFTTELYFKSFTGITDLTGIEPDNIKKEFWNQSIQQGTGNSQGIEFFLTKRTGNLTGLASYTYSSTTRKFENINNNEEYYSRWDRRHKFSFQMSYKFSDEFSINFAGVFMSGNPITVPTSKYFLSDGTLVLDYSQKNNLRLPNYKRIDIGFTKEIKPESHDTYHEYYGVQVYNIFGWDNPVMYQLRVNNTNRKQYDFYEMYYFKFIPSAFYRIVF